MPHFFCVQFLCSCSRYALCFRHRHWYSRYSSRQWQVVYSAVWSDTYTPVVILARKQKPLLGGLGKRRLNYSALKHTKAVEVPRALMLKPSFGAAED